ncbi:MAG TPA: S8 family serine peptidase [Actinomycetota bacterium]|nr:S8 family serine peptidase [Actinomycetota bacterium]
MKTSRVAAPTLCLALVGGALGAPGAAKAAARPRTPQAVVALIDTGINPYSPAFRDTSPLARRHPSTYLPGFPEDAEALKLTLGAPYDEAFERDEAVWRAVKPGKLYWIPGTRIAGAISFGDGGTSCESPIQVPPAAAYLQEDCAEHNILDDHGHGTMTASRAAGSPSSLAPTARIVAIEGLGARSVEWAAEQGWIDVQSNSWINLVPPPVPGATTEAFSAAAAKMLTLAASGNGTAYLAGAAPTPTYLLSTAPPGVVLVGGHDNGKATLWSGSPPHVVADAYAGMTAIARSVEEMRPDPIACCTSAASPYAAGGAAALVAEARRLLRSDFTGVRDGLVACGREGVVAKGPLADGAFTLEELRDVFLHTAEGLPSEGRDDGDVHWAGEPRPPDYVEYGPGGNPFCVGCTTTPVAWKTMPAAADAYSVLGYGGINEHSVAAGYEVLRGEAEMPERPLADAQYEADQQLRGVVFGANELAEPAPAGDCP